ncbi:MAG: DNA polymerase III subunit delta [Deltaproteobacteria bacterium]|nr:DNA polymerase III subunit delta [Deltaproteobacteria bacterium]
MALIKRSELLKLLKKGRVTSNSQVYLFFGERYLCRETADLLQNALLYERQGVVHAIDSEHEEFDKTLARLVSLSLLPGLQIYRVSNCLIFGGKSNSSGALQPQLIDIAIETFKKGLPKNNILIMVSESVDKRQRLFAYLKKNCTVVDCSVTAGAGAGAQKEQKEILREMMLKTLRGFGKKIEPRAVEMFFERVGFHPAAVVVETEKLALYAADRSSITCKDLQEMVGHSREDALFELTDAFSKKQTGRMLTLLAGLQDQGIHGLAILAAMRNFVRKMLIFRSIQMQPTPPWKKGLNANEFQNHYLPRLREEGEWNELLKGHPYALFMTFTRAAEYSIGKLKKIMELLLEAEFRLKGSPLPPQLVLEDLFLTMLHGDPGSAVPKNIKP